MGMNGIEPQTHNRKMIGQPMLDFATIANILYEVYKPRKEICSNIRSIFRKIGSCIWRGYCYAAAVCDHPAAKHVTRALLAPSFKCSAYQAHSSLSYMFTSQSLQPQTFSVVHEASNRLSIPPIFRSLFFYEQTFKAQMSILTELYTLYDWISNRPPLPSRKKNYRRICTCASTYSLPPNPSSFSQPYGTATHHLRRFAPKDRVAIYQLLLKTTTVTISNFSWRIRRKSGIP